jgi:uncharacterized iron-regulated protein
LKELLELKTSDREKIESTLKETLEKKRGKLENIKFDAESNKEYDENLAKFGKGDDVEEE